MLCGAYEKSPDWNDHGFWEACLRSACFLFLRVRAPFLNSVSHSSVKRKGDPTCLIISPLMVSFTLSLFLLTEVRCLIPVTLLLRGLNFLPLCFCGVTKLAGFGVSPNLNLMIHPIPLAVPG